MNAQKKDSSEDGVKSAAADVGNDAGNKSFEENESSSLKSRMNGKTTAPLKNNLGVYVYSVSRSQKSSGIEGGNNAKPEESSLEHEEQSVSTKNLQTAPCDSCQKQTSLKGPEKTTAMKQQNESGSSSPVGESIHNGASRTPPASCPPTPECTTPLPKFTMPPSSPYCHNIPPSPVTPQQFFLLPDATNLQHVQGHGGVYPVGYGNGNTSYHDPNMYVYHVAPGSTGQLDQHQDFQRQQDYSLDRNNFSSHANLQYTSPSSAINWQSSQERCISQNFGAMELSGSLPHPQQWGGYNSDILNGHCSGLWHGGNDMQLGTYYSGRDASHTGQFYCTMPTPGPPIQMSTSEKRANGADLFIFHIPNHFTNLDMCRLFRRYGTLLSVRIEVEKYTGRSRGFGFVSYDSWDSAELAIREVNGLAIGKKRLKVQYKGSTPSGQLHQHKDTYHRNNSSRTHR